MEVHLRVIHNEKSAIVAICDAGLPGETFRDGKRKLEVTPQFYGGTLCTIEHAMETLAQADIANLVGETTIQAAVNEGLVDPEAVIYFGKIPHVQMVRL